MPQIPPNRSDVEPEEIGEERDENCFIFINLIRAFDGPRHSRLEAIWDTIAEYHQAVVKLRVFNNPQYRLSHAECFQKIWDEQEVRRPNRFCIFTEYDFLPNLRAPNWVGVSTLLNEDAVMLGCRYATRHPLTKKLVRPGRRAGGWFLALDKEHVPLDLEFDGDPDPCNQLPDQITATGKKVLLFPGTDAYPRHYGIIYPHGTHLFWSRHYHDDPDRIISGVRMGTVQQKIDRAVTEWIRRQPLEFAALLKKRAPWVLSGSFSEYTAITDTSSAPSSPSGASEKHAPSES
jgi:hypothetical protein